MSLRVESEIEDDGRWIADIPDLPGVLAYGATRARKPSLRAEVLALRVIADRLEHGEPVPELNGVFWRLHEPLVGGKGPPSACRFARIGWSIKRQSGGSHRVLSRAGWPDFVFAFHDDVEIGPRMLTRIGKRTGLETSDL